jgi:hypothetical protein
MSNDTKSIVRRFIDEVFVRGRTESVDQLIAAMGMPAC